jgi:hypothetical protein
MANKILLCISSAQTVAALWGGGRGARLQRCEVFTPDEEGLAAFGVFLNSTSHALAYVAADTVEEDYRFETLPHATGSDRASLLDRKIRQYYRGTRFVSALPRGRTGDKRRDDKYLFSALTNPALVDPWLAALSEHGYPVAGVYLASTLTAALLPALNISFSRVLVAAPHRTGLRLTFYRDGEFYSSRLTRVIPQDHSEAARMLATELSHTRMYLSTLNLDAIDEPLNVVFLDHDDSLSPVVARIAAEAQAQGQGLECTCISRATLTRQLQIDPQHLNLAMETIYLSLIANKPPLANLAPATVTADYRLFQRKTALYAASAAIGAAGVAWSGFNVWHTHDLTQQTEDAARRTAHAQLQYKEITRTFPAAPTSSDNLIKAVDVYRQIVKSIRSPQPFLQIVSRAIESSPEVFLQEIGWNYGADRLDPAGTVPPSRNIKSAAMRETEGLRQSGTLTGEIRPFQGDYRAAIASINRVAERLARDPAVAEVKVTKLPLNVNPELTLTGNTRDATDQSGIAEFKIQLALKPDV